MPHGGHFCLANRCCFRMNTFVNGYIVSTVGELQLDSRIQTPFQEINLKKYVEEKYQSFLSRFDTVGCERFYETMVFKAISHEDLDFICCPWEANIEEEMASEGYNDPVSANNGHLKWCNECDKKKPNFPGLNESEDD